MRIVVTGGGGLTGGAVTAELVRRGHSVLVVTRRPRSEQWTRAIGADVALTDIENVPAMRGVLRDADCLVHMAGILLGEEVAAAGLSHLARCVVMSTAGVYSRFGRSAVRYRANEEALQKACPHTLLVRPTMIYGSPRDRNVHHVVRFARRYGVLPVPGRGMSLIQPINYRDLAAATAALVESDAGGVIDAGGPAPLTIRRAAEIIFRAVGRRPLLVPIPLAAALPIAALLDRGRGRWTERLLRSTEDRTVDNADLLRLSKVRLRGFDEGIRAEINEMEQLVDT